jgi:hypothetical protein
MQRLADAAPEAAHTDPQSVAEALARPDAAEWQAAMDREVASCLAFGVWEECWQQKELGPWTTRQDATRQDAKMHMER